MYLCKVKILDNADILLYDNSRMKREDKTSENIKVSMLLDFYGQLLTKKALEIMELYYNEDISFSEISENLGITRQAVHDTVKRSVAALENYESKLMLVNRFLNREKNIMDALNDIENKKIDKAKEKLMELITTL